MCVSRACQCDFSLGVKRDARTLVSRQRLVGGVRLGVSRGDGALQRGERRPRRQSVVDAAEQHLWRKSSPTPGALLAEGRVVQPAQLLPLALLGAVEENEAGHQAHVEEDGGEHGCYHRRRGGAHVPLLGVHGWNAFQLVF